MRRLLLLFTLGTLLAASPSLATVPSTVSYQGVLMDNTGAIVADGLYNFTFRIYDVGSGGAALWTETTNNVQVTRGGFSVLLGNITPIALPFDRPYYLGIVVNGQPELTPRVVLGASPFALSLRLPFAGTETSNAPLLSLKNPGTGQDIRAEKWLEVGGASYNGYLSLRGVAAELPLAELYSYLDISAAGGATPEIPPTPLGGALTLYDGAGNSTVRGEPDFNGSGAGFFSVSGSPGQYFQVDGNFNGTGSPRVSVNGVSSIALNASVTGNGSVALPNDAVSAPEMMDEPGIAQGRSTGVVSVTSVGTMADLVAVSITTPADGYIVLTASGQAAFSGTTGANYIIAQIDETAGGGENVTASQYVGGNSYPGTSNDYRPYFNSRVFQKPVGVYTFRLEAMKAGGGTAYIWNPTLTAQFIPTSYGTVTTLAQANEALSTGLSGRSGQVTSQDGATTGTVVVGDLRELELRVARETAQLAEAELRLAEAQAARQAQGERAGAAARPGPRRK